MNKYMMDRSNNEKRVSRQIRKLVRRIVDTHMRVDVEVK